MVVINTPLPSNSTPFPAAWKFDWVRVWGANNYTAWSADVEALLALRVAFANGASVLAAWEGPQDGPCLWPGVSCSPEGRVTALDLAARWALPAPLYM